LCHCFIIYQNFEDGVSLFSAEAEDLHGAGQGLEVVPVRLAVDAAISALEIFSK
jgi:hypothetical protein